MKVILYEVQNVFFFLHTVICHLLWLLCNLFNSPHAHMYMYNSTSSLYNKNEHRSIATGRCCTFVWEWSFLLVARYVLLVMFKTTSVEVRRSL